MLVGDGPLRVAVEAEVRALGLQDQVWLAGMRSDVPVVLRGLHVFVLPSRAEGISNTILEAMASGLPVLATSVGGNAELVVEGEEQLLGQKLLDSTGLLPGLLQLQTGHQALQAQVIFLVDHEADARILT